MILWTVLLVAGLIWMKIVVPEPFPQLHSKTLTLLTNEKFDSVVESAEVTQEAYPVRYYDSKMGYYKAYAYYSLFQYEKSLATLLDYNEKTTRSRHIEYKRLLADLYLTLKRTPEGLAVLLDIYQEMPLRNLNVLKEIQAKDPDMVVAKTLDPVKAELAYDTFVAFQKFSKVAGGYTGKMNTPSTAKTALRESLFFQASDLQVQTSGDTSIVSGVIHSRVNLNTMGYRLTAFGDNGLYLDEKECEIVNVKRSEGNPFSCALSDPGPVKSLLIYELQYEAP